MSVAAVPHRAAFTLPLAETSILRPGGVTKEWTAIPPALRAEILKNGFARQRVTPRAFAIGEFYGALERDGVPCLITIDTLLAIVFMVTDAALADAERRVSSPAMRALLERIDVRLAGAEPGARPDLMDGLHVAQGVVAVGRALLDSAYVAPDEVKDAVAAELPLIRAHAGPSESPVLRTPIDYSTFAPRGAVGAGGDKAGEYLAAQWLSAASFSFAADETSSRVNMSAARARTRGALLVARLVMANSDADGPLRQAFSQMDRLDELVFGDAAGTSPVALAEMALAKGFDLHDAKTIGEPASLERIRGVALRSAGSMELVPLRRAPEMTPWQDAIDADAGHPSATARDVVKWLGSTGWRGRADARHANVYASALDAIATWLGPSVADGTIPSTQTVAWSRRKEDGALAAWTALRHDSVPYAHGAVRLSSTPIAGGTNRDGAVQGNDTAIILVESHPEAIAALVGLVRQLRGGLHALDATNESSPSSDLLAEVQSILEVALAAAEDEAKSPLGGNLHTTELAQLPKRIGAVETRIIGAAGPFAAVVYLEGRSGRALMEGTAGIDALYAVVPDPRTGRPLLAVGAAVAHAETWISASAVATDREWALHLVTSGTP